jgi:large subunit ribosomal protein L9
MKVFFIKTIDGIGLSGEVKVVSDGYARNFLIPTGKVIEITNLTEEDIKNRFNQSKEKIIKVEKKRSALSDSIEELKMIMAVKVHDDGRLYGSIGAQDIVDELFKNGINISKNQVVLEKPIKKIGTYNVTIKLSSSLKPELKIKITAEK